MGRMLRVALLMLSAAAAVWAQFYERLGPAERRELAEAYYLVGRQYALQGERAKALEFEGLAFHLDPGLDPAAIAGEAAPPGAPPARPQSGAAAGQEAPEAMQALLQSRFLRLVSAFLAEDTPTLLSLMDGSLWFAYSAITQSADTGALAMRISSRLPRNGYSGPDGFRW